MTYSAYKLLHFIGVFMVLLSLGSLFAANSLFQLSPAAWRKFTSMTSGIGLLITFIAGFGLIAKLGIGFPPWVILKILVWVALGALISVSNRAPQASRTLWWSTFGLAALAAYLCTYRPI